MFATDRARMRETIVVAWRKRVAARPLTPLEAQIAEVVSLHPEYHPMLDDPGALHRDYSPAAGQINPFLHLAMHLGLREQLATDRPNGVRRALAKLERGLGDRHAAEHAAMECLDEVLRQAQACGQAPDDQRYMRALQARAHAFRRR